uniref:ABC1 atypical kinase-like domain-containing protein n=1 Tax=Chlamydomonas leiostraca TaxID=1034604 RepID=A0A7S0RBD2_9CHLO|mmetsp:Transcript_18612/g.47157  ORF Transcript_18612/g.47157 Transcript_18612/m.47157 type:complete len:638 (+) Transcript_18612:98-2011(+)
MSARSSKRLLQQLGRWAAQAAERAPATRSAASSEWLLPRYALLQQHRLLSSAASGSLEGANVLRRVLLTRVESEFQSFLAQHRSRLSLAASRLVQLEATAVAVGNSLMLNTTGQKLVAVLLPFALLQFLAARSHGSAYTVKPAPWLAANQPPRPKPLLQQLEGHLPQFVRNAIEELCIWVRGFFLAALFTPALSTAALAFYMGGDWRARWMELIAWTLERAGPAFIKWGQWASTRPDLFPPDLCAALERLQSSAPAHSAAASRAAVSAAFQRPLELLFDEFDDKPVASGSIAQIHRARLSPAGASYVRGVAPGTVVAVKVRHPGVTTAMHRDFELMQRAARAASSLPALRDLRLDESIRQFGGPLKEQLNLAVEADHLVRFKKNFRMWSNVTFPTPLFPLVSQDVLVESFEDGDLISTFVNQPQYKHRNALAEAGLHCYLQMLLRDNFIHADMHPGNILVKEVDTAGLRSWGGWLARSLRVQFPPQLILLDVGMIAELSDVDRTNLLDFFRSLTRQDGQRLGRAILNMSERHTCAHPDAFIAEMGDMFDKLDPDYITKHTSAVIQSVIETLRQHQVTLKSTVSTVVVTTLVLEGWSSKLNPDMRILDHMRDMLLVDWGDRISRTVDKIMRSGTLAVA